MHRNAHPLSTPSHLAQYAHTGGRARQQAPSVGRGGNLRQSCAATRSHQKTIVRGQGDIRRAQKRPPHLHAQPPGSVRAHGRARARQHAPSVGRGGNLVSPAQPTRSHQKTIVRGQGDISRAQKRPPHLHAQPSGSVRAHGRARARQHAPSVGRGGNLVSPAQPTRSHKKTIVRGQGDIGRAQKRPPHLHAQPSGSVRAHRRARARQHAPSVGRGGKKTILLLSNKFSVTSFFIFYQ